MIAGRLYFAAFDGVSGLEPWVSDGTAEGTFRLADVNPGTASSNPAEFTGFAREIYFRAHHADFGTELWVYDLLGDCRQTTPRACLNGDRFEVAVDWRSHVGEAAEGRGRPIPFSDQSTLFWFFNPDNGELVVKILDGRTINGWFWLFYGALSDVEYWIDARDRLTDRELTFYNPPNEICGASTIRAFPDIESPLTTPRRFVPAATELEDSATFLDNASGPGCQTDSTTLCLRDGRFKVTAEWRDQDTGRLHPGQMLPGTSESGYFWFFNRENLELIVKVLDGRTINGKFWVFYGALRCGVLFDRDRHRDRC